MRTSARELLPMNRSRPSSRSTNVRPYCGPGVVTTMRMVGTTGGARMESWTIGGLQVRAVPGRAEPDELSCGPTGNDRLDITERGGDGWIGDIEHSGRDGGRRGSMAQSLRGAADDRRWRGAGGRAHRAASRLPRAARGL